MAMPVMMVLPPIVGLAGMIAAFASLVPLAVWLVLVARPLFRLAAVAGLPLTHAQLGEPSGVLQTGEAMR
jgi:hypothetical protein